MIISMIVPNLIILAEGEHAFPFPINVKSSPETAFSGSMYYDCRRKQKIASHMLVV